MCFTTYDVRKSKYCILHDAARHCVAYTTEQQIYGLAAFGNSITHPLLSNSV